MAVRLTVVRKLAALLFLVMLALPLRAQLFAMSNPVNAEWEIYYVHDAASCQLNIETSMGRDWGWEPCGYDTWCETLYHYTVTDCYGNDAFACEADEWLGLDFAWACAADCSDNAVMTDSDFDDGTCSFECTCQY